MTIMPNNAGNVVLTSLTSLTSEVPICPAARLGLSDTWPTRYGKPSTLAVSVSATRRHLSSMLAGHSRQINIFSETFQLEYGEILLRRCIECRAV